MTTVFQHDPQVNVYNVPSWINGFRDMCHQMGRDAHKDGDIDRVYDMIHAEEELNALNGQRFCERYGRRPRRGYSAG